MSHDQFERELRAALEASAPRATPVALRDRVADMLARPPRPATAWPGIVAVTATASVLAVAAAVLLPGLRPTLPSGEPSGSSLTAPGTLRPSVPTPTLQLLDEPIDHPGHVQVGQLLTASDGWVHNTAGRLFITHSGGAAWRDVTPPGLESDVFRAFFVDPVHGWIGDDLLDRAPGQTMWRTVDSGVTWERLSVPGVNGPNWDLEFLSPDVGWLASDSRGQQAKLRWTADGGSTWSEPIDLAAATGIPTLEHLAFFDEQSGVMTAGDTLFRTGDGGRSWIAQVSTSTPDVSTWTARYGSVTILDHDSAMVVGTRLDATDLEASRVIVETGDAGRTWTVRYIDELRRSWAFLDRLQWVGTDGEQVWTTFDGGATFAVEPSTGLPLPLSSASMQFVDGDHAWASAVRACPTDGFGCTVLLFELYKTSDGGRSWSLVGDCQPGRESAFVCTATEPR